MLHFAPSKLEDAIWYSEADEPDWNSTEKLIIAYQVASGEQKASHVLVDLAA